MRLSAVEMLPCYRKLTTQTSVMNGTARAENIDVHKVYDVGGIMGMGEETQSQPSNR